MAAQPNIPDVDVAGQYLRDLVGQCREILRPPIFEKLSAVNIISDNSSRVDAKVDYATSTITIWAGLIDCVKYRIELTLIINAISKRLDEVRSRTGMLEADFKTLALRATMLPIHFMRSPLPLPQFMHTFDDNTKYDAYGALHGAMLFTLLHELAHLSLGHGEACGKKPEHVLSLALPENFTALKHRELEADQFALDAVIMEAREFVVVGAVFLFSFILDYEGYSGIANFDHPITVNRIARLIELAGHGNDPVTTLHLEKVLAHHLSLRRIAIDNRHPDEALLDARYLRSLRLESIYGILDSESECGYAANRLGEIFLLLSEPGDAAVISHNPLR